MNASEQLRNEMLNGGIVDKKKVLATITNGIKKNGYCLVWIPYNAPKQIHYGNCDIEIAESAELTAIKEICRAEGFCVKNAYHPVSGRNYGYEISL